MALTDRRDHDRIALQMPTKMWLDEYYHDKQIVFEGYAHTDNLSIGGTFLRSTYLLPVGFPLNLEMQIPASGDILRARGQVTHKLGEDEDEGPGMGVLFTAIDETNRERLLRFFISDPIRSFYEDRFVAEFPTLQNSLSLQDVALIVNLWEDREGRLTNLKAGSGAPPPPARAQLKPKPRASFNR